MWSSAIPDSPPYVHLKLVIAILFGAGIDVASKVRLRLFLSWLGNQDSLSLRGPGSFLLCARSREVLFSTTRNRSHLADPGHTWIC